MDAAYTHGVRGRKRRTVSGATATLAAFWGTWSQPTGLTSRTVWARKGAYLCVLSDTTPSVLPTAQAVESSADLSIAGKGCYTKR